MKKFLTFFLLLFSLQGYSQQELQDIFLETKPNYFKIKKKAEKYFREKEREKKSGVESKEEEEDGEYARYKRWEWYWRDRILPDGSFPNLDKQLQTITQTRTAASRQKIAAGAAAWTNISQTVSDGGFNGMGRTTAVAFHPTNKSIFYVGAPIGGIWKTIDGGLSYTPIGDNLPYVSVGNIVVDYNNPNNIYITVGDSKQAIGLGVYKSTDGGNTWTASLGRSFTDQEQFLAMAIHPSNPSIILVASSNGLYKTSDGGTTWTMTHPGYHSDVKFMPGNGSIVYTSVNDYWTTSEVYKSTDAGSTFPTKITNFNAHPVYLHLAVTPANPSLLGILCQNQNSYDVGPHQVYMYNNSNNTLTQKASITIGGADIFFISPANANILYAGNMAVLRSDDGGNTWNAKTASNLGTSLPEIHVDQHFVASNPLDAGYIYFCNDGGLWKGRESDNTWTNLSNGLLITQFYRIANSQSNVKRLIGGTQDNGGRKRMNDGSWAPTSGGDACEVAVDQSNDNIIYSSYPGGTIYRSTDYWTTDVDYNITNNISPVPSGDWVTPFALDPSNNATIVAGFDDVYRSLNRGTNWTKISTGLTTDPNIKLRTIAVAPSNSNVIYASYNNILCKTSNLGGTWTKSTVQVSSGVTSGNNITSIAVSYSDPNKVYVTVSGYSSGDKVYIYNNSNNTWTNISGTLPNVPINCIILQKNTTQDLYIGTDAGVYYRSTSATDWTHYGIGLPNTQVSDLEIYYAGSALRAGTYGRGIWETTLSTPGNTPPSVTLSISPTSYTAPANITLSATATDSDGTISKVEFYRGGTTLIGTSSSTASPYKFSWTSVGAGTYSVTAKAYDNLGATTTSSVVTVTVTNSTNNPPSVSLNISPTTYTAPANITLSAPSTDTDGTISKVEFYRGGTALIGTSSSTSSPYTFSWTGVAAGTYSVTAKAYDNLGATTTSSAVSVTVNPSTTCTAPVWSATTVYTAGNLVQYSGIKYQAAYWTQNQRPDLNNGPAGSGQPWMSLGTCTSKLASLAETMQDVQVAPNPVDVNLSINFNLNEANEVDIYIIDQLGKRVQNVYQGSMAQGEYHYDVNTSSLIPGIYSVVLQGVNGEKVIRFVKK